MFLLTNSWYRGKDLGSEALKTAKSEEELRWRTLTPSQKLKEWSIKNQYSVLAGGWALSMAVAGVIISRDKYVSRHSIRSLVPSCPV